LLGVGVPSLQSMVSSNRLTTQANMLVGALNVARSESIKRNQLVVVYKVGSSWAGGWEVFVDADNDRVKDAGEQVVRQYEAIEGNHINTVTQYASYIAYRPDGRSHTSGSFYVCSPAASASFRHVSVASSGQIRTENQDTVSDVAVTYASKC